MLRNPEDAVVSKNYPELNARKWSASDTVELAKAELKFIEILGCNQKGCSGFGAVKKQVILPKGAHAHRKLLSDISAKIDSDKSLAKAA